MEPDRILYAFYDIKVSPVSFDVLSFLVGAEIHRRQNGFDFVHLVVVPAESDAGHHDNKQFDSAHGDWRMLNVVLSIAGLLPSCKGTTVCSSRNQAEALFEANQIAVFPDGYTVSSPIGRHHTGWTVIAGHEGENVQVLRASDQAIIYARQWIDSNAGGRPCVPLTLREAPFGTNRNADPEVWAEFARRLDANGYFPVVLRDIDKALDLEPEVLEGIATFPEGVFNLDLRMALYEQSHVCGFVANGPAQACFYNRNVKFLYLVTGDWLNDKPTPFNRMGIDFDEHPPFANAFQRWIWRDQSADILIAEFEKLDADISDSISNGTYEGLLDPKPEYRLPLPTISKRFYDWSCRTYFASPEEADLAMHCLSHFEEYDLDEREKLLRAANISMGHRNFLKAGQLMEEVGERFGFTPELKVQLGLLREAQGELDSAIDLYENAYEETEQPPEIIFRLGVVYQQTGRIEDSITQLQRLTQAGVRTPVVYLELGKSYEANNQPGQAMYWYEHAENLGIIEPEILKRKLALQRAGVTAFDN